MSNQSDRLIDPMTIVQELASLPHRGATTKQERKAADMVQRYLEGMGAAVTRQKFQTAKTYISEVWWLVGGLALGLLLIPLASWFAFGLVTVCAGLSLVYFDWRHTPVSLLPPRAISENVIGVSAGKGKQAPDSTEKEKKRLILMAHYDSAPVSLLYLPSMVKNFRQSLLISLGLMVVAVFVALFEVLAIGQPLATWLRWLLAIYFLSQAMMSTIDYIRYGFTNGAADNATGTAIAMATAERLWKEPLPGWEVEVVLTGAEETGMAGAKFYYKMNRERFASKPTYLFNFDNIGSGDLKIITKTGSISNVIYDNALARAAMETASSESRFNKIKTSVWHTGDFDSIWFVRGGIPGLTLSAQDENGQIPNLHRPSDTIENVDASLPPFAVEFAEATVRRLANQA
ncbi:MAG: M28 family peptidase [Desulfobacterales bacterium]